MVMEKRKENWHPNSGNKATYINARPYSNYIAWAMLKQMREHNDNKKIYDINPYVEVFKFRENFYGLFTLNLDGAGDVWMYLIDGPEKAMLIDTAYGLGDLKGLVKQIIGDKEYIVVNTHTGPDHVLGNFRFDRIYCHEYEVYSILKKCSKDCFDYLFDENGGNKYVQFDKKDLPTYKKFELVGLEDGHIFDLGQGYEVELLWTAGHAAGHAMYLDKNNRILISGDCLIAGTNSVGMGPRYGDPYGKYSTIEAYYQQMKKVAERIDEYDYIFGGHYGVEFESNVIVDVVETAEKILKDPTNYDYKKIRKSADGSENVIYCKYIPNFSCLAYKENGIYMEKAQKIVDEYLKKE